MALKSRFKNFVSKLFTPIYSNQTGSSWMGKIGESFTGAWQRNITLKVEMGLEHFAVYTCVNRIANDISKMEWRLMRKQDEIWVPNYKPRYQWVIDLLHKPNRNQYDMLFKARVIISALLHGNAYILKERYNGQIKSLYVLDPTRTTTLCSDDGSVFYRLKADNLAGIKDDIEVPASEIIHFRINCLYHDLIGISPLTAIAYPVHAGLNMQRSSLDFFKNASRPSGLLIAPETISDQTAKELRDTWNNQFSGENAGKIAVIGDNLKFEQITMSASDSQLIEQLKFSAEQICSVFNVPSHMVIGGAPTYNNIEALNQQYLQQALHVYIQNLENCMYYGLELDQYDDDCWPDIDVSSLVRMDTNGRYDSYNKGISGGWMTPNEARAKEGLSPLDGGDTAYMQQQNYSLSALAERDKNNPLALPAPAPAAPIAPIAQDSSIPVITEDQNNINAKKKFDDVKKVYIEETMKSFLDEFKKGMEND